MRLIVKHNTKEYELNVDIPCEQAQKDGRIGEIDQNEEVNLDDHSDSLTNELETHAPTNLGELRQWICEHTGCDLSTLKLIHKGKFIVAPMEKTLSELKFKDHDKIIVMGVPAREDPGIELLTKYEKNHLTKLSESHKTNGNDITELERNFLEGAVLNEMLRRMNKRLMEFTETALRHLESIDALDIYGQNTSEEQKCRNREKRKSLVDRIQELLRENDKYAFRLKQYKISLEYK